jgi:hypothetical protein
MIDRRNIRHLLAALGFLACQWLLVVHASEHQLKSAPDAACQLCTMAHAAGTAPATPQLPATSLTESFTPVFAAPAALDVTQLRLPPSCGPPSILA